MNKFTLLGLGFLKHGPLNKKIPKSESVVPVPVRIVVALHQPERRIHNFKITDIYLNQPALDLNFNQCEELIFT